MKKNSDFSGVYKLRIYGLAFLLAVIIIIISLFLVFYTGKRINQAGILIGNDRVEFAFFIAQIFISMAMIFILSNIASRFLRRFKK